MKYEGREREGEREGEGGKEKRKKERKREIKPYCLNKEGNDNSIQLFEPML